MSAYISVSNVCKKYKYDIVLDKVSLDMEKGKVYGFVGRNGSGKTVLFKMIAGLLKPDSGEIIVGGKTLGKDVDFPENLGIMIETPGFLKQYSAYKNLEYLAKIKNRITKDEIMKAIEAVGLDANDRKHVGKYSLGMKQRLGIAQAIMENPQLLILDEPMNSLDEEGIVLIRNIIIKMREHNASILISSHYKEDIALLCDEVFEIKNHRLSRIR